MPPSPRVLAVDDQPRYLRAIQLNLEASGFDVRTTRHGQTAIELAAREDPAVILLDVRLPDLDGFEVCRRIRVFSAVPVMLVTALADYVSLITGLDAGADDVVIKPFGACELIARVQAVLCRCPDTRRRRPIFQAGPLRVDFTQQRVYVSGVETALEPNDYRLLCELIAHAGRALTPAELLDRVWQRTGETDANRVWQAIYRLRQAIEHEPSDPELIVTQRGEGYRLAVPG